nr:hypothetical protein [Tanacetum cinerariifolium]
EIGIMPAGKGAKAHGEVGKVVLVLFRCRKGGLCQLGIEGKRTWGGRGVIWYCFGVARYTGVAVGKGGVFGGNGG